MDSITLRLVFWLAMALLVLVVLPIWTAINIRQHLHRKRIGDLPATRSGTAIGNVLQELDRLVARPSAEFTVEAETPILKREDDQGGK